MVAATAGNVPEADSPTGQNLMPFTEILKPLRATAYRCGLPWTEPFLLYRAGKLENEDLADAAASYAQLDNRAPTAIIADPSI